VHGSSGPAQAGAIGDGRAAEDQARTWFDSVPSHLSRLLRGLDDKPASSEVLTRICEAFDLSRDFLPEVREPAVIEAIKNDATLRDEIYHHLR
jgi:hypothetical protein